MKHLKRFENVDSNINCYYKIIIDGSFDKFLVALDKIGVKREDVFNDWGARCFDDISSDTKKYFKNKSICFAIYKGYYNNNLQYFVKKREYDFPSQVSDNVRFNYKGEITVEDYDVDANKYNL